MEKILKVLTDDVRKVFWEDVRRIAKKVTKIENMYWKENMIVSKNTFIMITKRGLKSEKLNYKGTFSDGFIEFIGIRSELDIDSIYFTHSKINYRLSRSFNPQNYDDREFELCILNHGEDDEFLDVIKERYIKAFYTIFGF